jgi:hypothetical protein
MIDRDLLREAILASLSSAVDPETGVDVVRMRLIEDLAVDEAGVPIREGKVARRSPLMVLVAPYPTSRSMSIALPPHQLFSPAVERSISFSRDQSLLA